MRVDRAETPHVVPGRGGLRPTMVVLHSTDGTYSGTIEWFSREESGVSAHYLVALDGRITQFVEEADTARHAGRVRNPTRPLPPGNPNLYSIGIEFEDDRDPDGVERGPLQYRSGALVLRGIAERWSIPLDRGHVVGHRELFDAKRCPGNLDIDRLLREAAP